MEIIEVSWSERSYRDILRSIRQKVFIEEQGVPAADEWDDKDDQALHFLALDGKRRLAAHACLKTAILAAWRYWPNIAISTGDHA